MSRRTGRSVAVLLFISGLVLAPLEVLGQSVAKTRMAARSTKNAVSFGQRRHRAVNEER